MDRDNENVSAPLYGETFMLANLGMWYGYLAYNEEEFKSLKNKKAAETAAATKAIPKKRK
jgi:hypothetical protein